MITHIGWFPDSNILPVSLVLSGVVFAGAGGVLNLAQSRFRGWWDVANKEQLVSFWFICVFSITIFSTLAYSTVFGQNIAGQANLAFIKAEGEVLKAIVAP